MRVAVAALLSLSPDVEVLEPAALRADVAVIVHAGSDNYANTIGNLNANPYIHVHTWSTTKQCFRANQLPRGSRYTL